MCVSRFSSTRIAAFVGGSVGRFRACSAILLLQIQRPGIDLVTIKLRQFFRLARRALARWRGQGPRDRLRKHVHGERRRGGCGEDTKLCDGVFLSILLREGECEFSFNVQRLERFEDRDLPAGLLRRD
jgi:hypothetical protein